MPPQARWPEILAAASTKDVAKRIDDGLSAIEAENRELRNMLPRVYARAPLSAELLGSLVETIAKIGFGKDPEEARDVLGRTYEYFIKEFARAEGHRTRGFDEAAVARRPQQAVAELHEELTFLKMVAGEVRKIASPTPQATAEAERAVRQFMPEGLAAGEIVEASVLADRDGPTFRSSLTSS